MHSCFWNDWHFGWGWFLWFGIIFPLFSSLDNWRQTYSTHRKYGRGQPRREKRSTFSTNDMPAEKLLVSNLLR